MAQHWDRIWKNYECSCCVVELKQFDANLNGDVDIYGCPWALERLLWIGYHKNITNTECMIPKIPKSILWCILEYL